MFVTENFWSRSDSLRNLSHLNNFGVKYAKFGVFSANPGLCEIGVFFLTFLVSRAFSNNVGSGDHWMHVDSSQSSKKIYMQIRNKDKVA